MKNTIRRLLLLVAVSFFLQGSHAATGKAVVPITEYWRQDSNNWGTTYLYVSNVTDRDAEVVITLFDTAGTVVLDGDLSPVTGLIQLRGSFSNYQESPSSGGTARFVIGGGGSVRMLIYENAPGNFYVSGHGRIEWSQGGNNVVALVAHQKYYHKSLGVWSQSSIMINGGLPF